MHCQPNALIGCVKQLKRFRKTKIKMFTSLYFSFGKCFQIPHRYSRAVELYDNCCNFCIKIIINYTHIYLGLRIRFVQLRHFDLFPSKYAFGILR